MRWLLLPAVVLVGAGGVRAYVEAPHTLGRCCKESTNVVLVEVTKVNKEKGLIIYKKLRDLKGKQPDGEIKHNIGQRGFHAREWQNVMAWAAVGKKAVFFHNGGASETCIGTYWYQCYREGDWWGMSHAEPFLMRTYYGDPEKLADAVARIEKGEEVVVPCLADGNKEQLHLRKGKLQRLRASLKRFEYDAKRDFVGWGGGDGVEELVKTTVLLAAGAEGWRFVPSTPAAQSGGRWRNADFDDRNWRTGKAPVGYGEDELKKRRGTIIAEQGRPFLFRRAVDVPAALIGQKGVTFQLSVASDDSAEVYLNGVLVDRDPEQDHEFSYWNRDVEVEARHFRPGRNVLAVLVKNHQGSSDLYFDLELSAQITIQKGPKPPVEVKKPVPANVKLSASPAPPGDRPVAIQVDREKRTIAIPCVIAPRKLPTLDQIYPIEVVGTYPTPRGRKAHETIVNFVGVRPGEVHRALEALGLKPGKPARGEDERASGPEVGVFLEVPGPDGKPLRVPIEQTLIDMKTGKSPQPFRWRFTGSVAAKPDPDKEEWIYGADLSGTFIALFPVTDETVLQSDLTLKDELGLKLETNRKVLPKEGTPVKLIIAVK